MAIIRVATEEDIPRILELYEELVTSTTPAERGRTPSLDDYRRIFEQTSIMPGHELIVAEEDGEVIGTMVLLIVPNLSHHGLPWAVVENVVTDRRFQRKGIGRLMMEYAINRAREAGCYKLQLASSKTREDAHRFYESLGFEASAHGFRLYF
ncbi:MAG TPA: GNAT family N-acetyltransferase [Dehalococcoidia bacterium]|nr:GNAT family N-acetyltransferase [Dehalococcoidia bacterium]